MHGSQKRYPQYPLHSTRTKLIRSFAPFHTLWVLLFLHNFSAFMALYYIVYYNFTLTKVCRQGFVSFFLSRMYMTFGVFYHFFTFFCLLRQKKRGKTVKTIPSLSHRVKSHCFAKLPHTDNFFYYIAFGVKIMVIAILTIRPKIDKKAR